MFLIKAVYAQCPVCIVTVGGGMLLAQKLGIESQVRATRPLRPEVSSMALSAYVRSLQGLAAQLFAAFIQADMVAALGCNQSRIHACRATTDDHDFFRRSSGL